MRRKLTFGGAGSGPKKRPGAAAEAAAAEAASRLAALSSRYASAGAQGLDSHALEAVHRAIADKRYEDALDLLDIVLDSEPIEIEVDDDEIPEPIQADMEAARVWRYHPDAAFTSAADGTHLFVAGGRNAAPLEPAAVLQMEAESWEVSTGPLQPYGESRLELGLKGELMLVLFSGAVRLKSDDGKELGSLVCEGNAHAVGHFFFSKSEAKAGAMNVAVCVDPLSRARGLWVLSARSRLPASAKMPDTDLFLGRHFLPVPAAGGEEVFCPGATPLNAPDYAHDDRVQSGELSLFRFEASDFSEHEGWTVQSQSADIKGMQPASAPKAECGEGGRELRTHLPGAEVFVALNGTTWVAVGTEREASGETQGKRVVTRDRDHPHRMPAWIATLFGNSGSDGRGDAQPGSTDPSHDVMVMDPVYPHTAWTLPGSGARFIHAFFSDPARIALKRQTEHGVEHYREKDPQEADKSGGGRFVALQDRRLALVARGDERDAARAAIRRC
jgi:hypothetical protein